MLHKLRALCCIVNCTMDIVYQHRLYTLHATRHATLCTLDDVHTKCFAHYTMCIHHNVHTTQCANYTMCKLHKLQTTCRTLPCSVVKPQLHTCSDLALKCCGSLREYGSLPPRYTAHYTQTLHCTVLYSAPLDCSLCTAQCALSHCAVVHSALCSVLSVFIMTECS